MIITNNRELSWLAFNDRVLQEARDPSVPLMQRRFLGIFSSNQDEFIKVRLANLVRMTQSKLKSGRKLSGDYLPGGLLPLVNDKIHKNQKIFTRVYDGILVEMEAWKWRPRASGSSTKPCWARSRGPLFSSISPAWSVCAWCPSSSTNPTPCPFSPMTRSITGCG